MASHPSLEGTLQLQAKNVTKAFVKGKPVLNGVNLDIASGEIHALAGANGSGKSTLVKILAGYHTPDEGTSIAVAGREMALPIHPLEIRRAGVRFVHQETGFIAGMSVLDNMCLGRGYLSGFGFKIRWREEARIVQEALERHQVEVDLGADAVSLAVGQRAKLAIVRALLTRPGEERRVVVLDEPTAALGREEAMELGEWLRTLAETEGIGVLFIGHRPQELRDIADRISVLRNGTLVATFRSEEVGDEELVEAIVGTRIGAFYPSRTTAGDGAAPVMEVRHVGGVIVEDVSFPLRAGEIVGATGLQGSGFEELPYLLYDSERRARGTVVIDGKEFSVAEVPIAAHLRNGVALVPADRVRNAVAVEMSVSENVAQPQLPRFVRSGFLRRQEEKTFVRNVVDALSLTPRGTETRVGVLSGGNQQKVVVGKWLATGPRVLLLHEPTEGIDVMTKRELFRILAERVQQGMAVLLSTIEYEDLAHICDRILVFGHGRVQIELEGGHITGEDVMRAAYAASLREPGSRNPA